MSDLISRARAGDEEAFRALTEPHRRELLVHCYRMLGSLQDAEDALQDTFVGAWQGLGSFQERASMRTWLYRIATNRCLNALRTTKRRPAKAWDVPGMVGAGPDPVGEATWLEPFPETLLEGAYDLPLGPEARYEQTESISLAFVAALQVLPPLQLAVLVLRDVLGFPASEVAGMLDRSLESVTSALKRARATLERSRPTLVGRGPSTGSGRGGRAGARRALRRGVRGGRRGRSGRAADRRRVHVDAPDPVRVRRTGPGRRSSSSCSSAPASSRWSRPGRTGSRPSVPTSPEPTAYDVPAA